MTVSLYLRVSTEDQTKEGYSLEVQREHLESFTNRENYAIFKIYCDDEISAYFTRRHALQELLQDTKAKKFDFVLVCKIDRFSCNLKDLLNLVDELEKLKNKLKINRRKQSKLTDAYLENLLSEKLYEQKNQGLRTEEEKLQKRIALQDFSFDFFTHFNYFF